ncbi:hypothetical protein [Corynebacterium lowii]|uniref:Alkaline shock response membrane anchor protein AmaP n=1 Tax=Corynebacterium lowii TaxID=1544413 RepID=A0A0Q0UG98_9CORY|nr:hypothetical protein [Corynebacterium lowii]KQB87369.1 hypothetical protein Clow_00428 [Corynebacterium lowii]MDP9852041.1 hypothetical protein [Corynebacterium lowii]
MSHALSALNRIILILLGLLSLAGGLWGIASWQEFEPIQQLNENIDASVLSSAQDSPWYLVALWAVMILGVILGLWWIAANLRRRGFNRLRSQASTNQGSIDISVSRTASALGEYLEEVPGVTRVRHKVAFDRSRPTISWTIRAASDTNVADLRAAVEESEKDLRAALPGMDIDSVYKINLASVPTS